MITWALSQIKCQKHRLIWWRNVGSPDLFCLHRFCYLNSVNHKIVTWNTNKPIASLGDCNFTIFFNLLFPLNCVCCHLFSADNFCFHVQFQSRKLAPDRRTASNKFPGGSVVFANSPDRLSGKLFFQPLPLRIDKSRFSVKSTYVKIVLYSSVTPLSEGKMVMNE